MEFGFRHKIFFRNYTRRQMIQSFCWSVWDHEKKVFPLYGRALLKYFVPETVTSILGTFQNFTSHFYFWENFRNVWRYYYIVICLYFGSFIAVQFRRNWKSIQKHKKGLPIKTLHLLHHPFERVFLGPGIIKSSSIFF